MTVTYDRRCNVCCSQFCKRIISDNDDDDVDDDDADDNDVDDDDDDDDDDNATGTNIPQTICYRTKRH